MDWQLVLQITGVFIAVMVAAGAGFGGFWYAFRSKEQKLLQEQVKETREAVERCEAKHAESEKSVSNLQGQIAELKAQLADFRDLPLRSIQATQADILVTQKAIVGLLKKIENNQPNKDKVARAVRQVKTDLMAS